MQRAHLGERGVHRRQAQHGFGVAPPLGAPAGVRAAAGAAEGGQQPAADPLLEGGQVQAGAVQPPGVGGGGGRLVERVVQSEVQFGQLMFQRRDPRLQQFIRHAVTAAARARCCSAACASRCAVPIRPACGPSYQGCRVSSATRVPVA